MSHTYPFEQAAQAYAHILQGHNRGKTTPTFTAQGANDESRTICRKSDLSRRHRCAARRFSDRYGAAQPKRDANGVVPSYTITPLTDKTSTLISNFAEHSRNATPMHRSADPLEVAHLDFWLTSDKASFVTGQIVAADGGYLLNGMPLTQKPQLKTSTVQRVLLSVHPNWVLLFFPLIAYYPRASS